MTTEPERHEDELRYLVGALREHLGWQEACGGYGLPEAPPQKRQETALSDEVDPQASTVAPARGMTGARPDARPAAAQPPSLQQPVSQPPPKPSAQPQQRRVRRAVEPAEQRTKRLAELEAKAKACARCPLHKSRKNVVYGVGPVDVDILIAGEGPGAEEDAQGEPFVGKAGKLLDKMLAAMGYDRGQVYIANIVKCRPPENRTPDVDEMDACIPYLHEQIDLVRPKVIIAMGSTAVRGLLGVSGVTRIRGRWKLYDAEIPVMPTFHPAYLLRNEGAKRDVWNDLKAVLKHLQREIPTRKR